MNFLNSFSIRIMAIMLSLIVISFVSLFAQEEPLPRFLTEQEKEIMAEYSPVIDPAAKLDVPPPSRSMAEWEELRAIAIAWSNSFGDIQAQIVKYAIEECTVVIITNNETTTKSYLDAHNVDYSENVIFYNASYNSLWIRDYGPNTIYYNDVDSMAVVDWIYNRPRPLDDQIPSRIGELLNIPVHQTNLPPSDLVHTGGNYMSDGQGTAFSSNLVLDENGPFNNWGFSNHDEAAVDNIMQQYMGIHTYPKMVNLPYDAIHHIDMHMKLLDEERMIVGEYPPGIADGPQIEANIQYIIDNYQNMFGKPYEIIRIPMIPDDNGRYPHQGGDYRTYSNAMFINKTILLPVYEEQYDTTAIRIWEEAMPGYKVRGIDCNKIIPLSGALHCIIKEIGVLDPILIVHETAKNQEEHNTDGYEINAKIQHRDDISESWIHFRYEPSSPFDSVSLTQGNDDLWTGIIPDQGNAQHIQYFISARSDQGKKITRPLPGPEGPWNFRIGGTVANENVNIIEGATIYPNPADNFAAIDVTTFHCETITTSVYNLHGKKVIESRAYEVCPSGKKITLNCSILPSGVYIVQLRTNEGERNLRMIVQ
jgi:agmatine/peptidylarginine deiminase